jgi:hypothetical protein
MLQKDCMFSGNAVRSVHGPDRKQARTQQQKQSRPTINICRLSCTAITTAANCHQSFPAARLNFKTHLTFDM